jgi:methylamine---glutamate N-methyltransferase subunit B
MDTSLESSLQINLEISPPLEILSVIRNHRRKFLHREGSARPQSEHVCFQQLMVIGAKGQDHIGAGVRDVPSIAVDGPIGDFGFCSFGDGECLVDGSVGEFFGHSIHSGILIAKGHAKHGVAALGVGGLVAIYGNAGDRVAVALQGADVVVRGSVGNCAGLGMQDGCLIVGGNAGSQLGHQMKGGAIYLRGEAASISSDVEECRLREPDRLKIGLLLLKAGIKAAGKEFRVYRPIQVEN